MKFKLNDELRAVCNEMFKWLVRENTRNPGGIIISLTDGSLVDPNILLEMINDVLNSNEYNQGQRQTLNELRTMWIRAEGYNKKDFKYSDLFKYEGAVVYKFR